MANWQKIKTEYITTDTSYRKLGEKYNIHYKVISERGKAENWVALRSQHRDKTLTKSLERICEAKADRMARIQDATDRLLEKVEQAIAELNIQIAKTTHREKIVEYNNPERPDKPTKEIVDETERILEITSIVDRLGLKQIASALKDIKEVQMLKSELDRQEQEAKIANLRKMAEKDDDGKEVIVEMTDEVVEYSG